MSLKIVKVKTRTRRTCFRCLEIGLPAGGIPAGQVHVRVTRSRRKLYACLDCYKRLFNEVKTDGEGEEWKS